MLQPVNINPHESQHKRLGIAPIPVFTINPFGEGWLTGAQVADFFAVSVRDIPGLIKKGLKPPVRLSHKNVRYPLSSVLEFNEQLKSMAPDLD